MVRDEATCGIAWQKGLALGNNPYVWYACDDLEVTSPTWAKAAIAVVDRGQIPCPLIHRPDGGIESCGGDMNAPACLITSKSDDGTVVDFTPSPFMSREMAEKIGMHDGHYMTDVYVSHKGRQLGYETVICKDFQLTHHHHMHKRRQPTAEDDSLYRAALDA